ncbi:unnamed protein product [Urochloa decumbens]|uniref:F-box domain-containing protein n=1 Tax=Urochloa decumbens TaxID=240449 RepID=A0ABC8W868_9POAL
MSSPHPPPPPPPSPPPAPTTITALNDDLLREIFLRLPAVTTLARAAFSCRAFLRAVRSSPAFRELHAPPLIAFLTVPYMRGIVPAAAGRGGFQFRAFTDLLQDDDASEWRAKADSHSDVPYHDGYVCFTNRTTDQWADYSPHSQALNIFPKKPNDGDDTCLEFHMLSPDGEEQRPSRVVCVHHDRSWLWERVAVFSSHTMEWQIFPPTVTLLLGGDRNVTGTVVRGFICWVHKNKDCILALNTVTFQFSRMDLPPPLKLPFSEFILGQTKDGKLCIVHVHECNLSVWLRTTDDDSVERFMLHKMHPLHTIIKEVTERSELDGVQVRLMTVSNGFVYLSVYYWGPQASDSEWFMSFCLETAEVNILLNEGSHLPCPVDAYIMTSWPSYLIHNKDLEHVVTGGISEDDSPIAIEETSNVLFTAVHSFKETLIDDDNVNFLEIDAFLLDDEKNSLLNTITTLESGLANARDHVLRISFDFDDRKGMETGSW